MNNAHKYNLRCPIVCKATQHCVGRWRYENERWARLLCVLLQLCSQKQQQCLMFLEIKTRFQTASEWHHHKAAWIALVYSTDIEVSCCCHAMPFSLQNYCMVFEALDILVIPAVPMCGPELCSSHLLWC